MKTEITEAIKREIFDTYHQYEIEHVDDPHPVLLFPMALKRGFMDKYNLTYDQMIDVLREFQQAYTGGKFYPHPLDILKDHIEHEEFIMSHVYGPDYKSLSEEEKSKILESQKR